MDALEAAKQARTPTDLPDDPALARLADVIRGMGSALVCYSGGVDSAFVLLVAHKVLGDRAIGMTAVSASLAPRERDGAIAIAKAIGARHELVSSNEIEDEGYAKNGVDRCFYCKSELYRIAAKKRVDWEMAFILNGTNTDDLGDYRPGLDAAREAEARSPLVEAEINKEEVRRLSKLLGLPVWDKPASACLSSRLPYGTRVTAERLHQIGALEESIAALGIRQARVRWHALGEIVGTSGGAIARIEIAKDEMMRAFEVRDEIVARGIELGFAYVTLDLAGYRRGSHNEVLSGRSLRVLS